MSLRRKDGTPHPIYDPESRKYPAREFFKGKWRTKKQIEQYRTWARVYGSQWKKNKRATDPAYRQREIDRSKKRYATNSAFRERELQKKKELYANDPFVRLRITQGNRRRAAQKRKETRLAEDQAA